MKILIVDDDILVSNSLQTILESNDNIKVVGIGNDGTQAISLYNEHHPDLLLMDIRMPNLTGLDAAKDILEKYPKAKILFLTTFSDDEYIIQAIKIGAKGYILKQDFSSILSAIEAINLGQTVFGNQIITKLPNFIEQDTVVDDNKEKYLSFGLTQKESEIIQNISNGLSNKEISLELFLSEGTVRNYISTILDKLQLRDRTQIAIFYYTNLI